MGVRRNSFLSQVEDWGLFRLARVSRFAPTCWAHARLEADQGAHIKLLLSSSRLAYSRDKVGLARPTFPVTQEQSFQVIFQRIAG
jgi:hypothetical protein